MCQRLDLNDEKHNANLFSVAAIVVVEGERVSLTWIVEREIPLSFTFTTEWEKESYYYYFLSLFEEG